MFEISSKILGLGHALLDKNNKNELERLLRMGAYYALNDIEEENYDEEHIEQILNRSKSMILQEQDGSFFTRSQFDVVGETIDFNDPDFWLKIIPSKKDEDDEPLSDDSRMRTRNCSAIQSKDVEENILDD
jgi:hypothetical protein